MRFEYSNRTTLLVMPPTPSMSVYTCVLSIIIKAGIFARKIDKTVLAFE